MLKIRAPRFLAPKRKYEVNESMWLVQFGRPKVILMMKMGRLAAIEILAAWRRGEFGRRANLIGRSVRTEVADQGHNASLFFQWGKIPEDWELSFVSSMKLAESQGVTFTEVLRTNLPGVIGDAPSQVLLRWVRRKDLREPRRFMEAVEEMFGPSSKRMIIGLQNALDPEKILEAHEEPELKFQSLIDAIRRADEERAFLLQPPEEIQPE